MKSHNTLSIVDDIMNALMKQSLAVQYNLNGQNKKISFKKTCPIILKSIISKYKL